MGREIEHGRDGEVSSLSVRLGGRRMEKARSPVRSLTCQDASRAVGDCA